MRYRRIRGAGSGLAPTILIGLGVGLAAGFLLGELYSGTGLRRVRRAVERWRAKSPDRPTAQALTIEVQTALAPLLGTDSQSLELIAVGRNGLELHGWVASRSARARSIATARRIAGPARPLVDRLLVWGEDDVTGTPPSTEEPETA